jgi:hypothetical protein
MIESRPDDEDKILEDICDLNSMNFSLEQGFIDPFSSESGNRSYIKASKMKKKTEMRWENARLKRNRRGQPINVGDNDEDDNEEVEERSNAPHLTRLND